MRRSRPTGFPSGRYRWHSEPTRVLRRSLRRTYRRPFLRQARPRPQAHHIVAKSMAVRTAGRRNIIPLESATKLKKRATSPKKVALNFKRCYAHFSSHATRAWRGGWFLIRDEPGGEIDAAEAKVGIARRALS